MPVHFQRDGSARYSAAPGIKTMSADRPSSTVDWCAILTDTYATSPANTNIASTNTMPTAPSDLNIVKEGHGPGRKYNQRG